MNKKNILSILSLPFLLFLSACHEEYPQQYGDSAYQVQKKHKKTFHNKPKVAANIKKSQFSLIDKLPSFAKVSQKLRYKIKQDYVPKQNIPTHFKMQTPKNEPLSHYGNPTSYDVDGRTYQVLASSDGYHVRGTASWYGMKFHKERTSSGESYDMYALTAAHKTLPLPTYVRVTNLQNRKEAIIKINDRGPFHSDRVLDLSYGAAVKLGVFPNGTAPVEIVALTPIGGSRAPAKYYVQAGAFSTSKAAELQQKIVAQYTRYPVKIEHYSGKNIIVIGPMNERYTSESLRDSLKSHGINTAFSMLG